MKCPKCKTIDLKRQPIHAKKYPICHIHVLNDGMWMTMDEISKFSDAICLLESEEGDKKTADLSAW